MSGRDSVGWSANSIWWDSILILCFGTFLWEVLILLSSSPGHQRGNMHGMEISFEKRSQRKLFGHKLNNIHGHDSGHCCRLEWV